MEVPTDDFPVRQKQFSIDIKGNKTDFVICSYDDHFLVMATQIGSLGTIIHARKEEEVSTEPTFDVSVIFGKREEPMMISCGRQLIEHISKSGSSKSLVLSLGLRDHSVMEKVMESKESQMRNLSYLQSILKQIVGHLPLC